MTATDLRYIAGLPEEEFLDLCESFIAPGGRLIVLMDAEPLKRGVLFLPQGNPGQRLSDKKVLPGTVVSSGIRGYLPGDKVYVKPWEGLHIGHGDLSLPCSHKIPKGRELRFFKPQYGTDEKHRKVLTEAVTSVVFLAS